MRPGTVHDLPGVYRVCLLTGAAGADASALHDDPDLLGHVWAGPYLVFPDTVTRVMHDEHGVAGYCLAVPDTAPSSSGSSEVWLPPLRERHPLGSGATPADAGARRAPAPPHHRGCRPARRAPGAPARRPPAAAPGPGLGTTRRGGRAGGAAAAGATGRPPRAWTRATWGRSGSTSGSASPSWRAHRAPASTACRPRVTELRCPSAGRGTAAGRSASAPRSGSRTSRRASPRRAPSPRTARRCRGHRGRGTPGPRR